MWSAGSGQCRASRAWGHSPGSSLALLLVRCAAVGGEPWTSRSGPLSLHCPLGLTEIKGLCHGSVGLKACVWPSLGPAVVIDLPFVPQRGLCGGLNPELEGPGRAGVGLSPRLSHGLQVGSAQPCTFLTRWGRGDRAGQATWSAPGKTSLGFLSFPQEVFKGTWTQASLSKAWVSSPREAPRCSVGLLPPTLGLALLQQLTMPPQAKGTRVSSDAGPGRGPRLPCHLPSNLEIF